MGVHFIKSKERLDAWLLKSGYPKSATVAWAITPDKGKICEDAWSDYDYDGLPDNVMISIRSSSSDTIAHFIKKPDDIPTGDALLPPEIVSARRDLERWQDNLKQREIELRETEQELRVMESEIKKSQFLTVKIQSDLNLHTKSAMDNLKEYEEHLKRRKTNDEEYLRELSDALGELSELKENHLLFSKVSYTIDKIASSFALRGAMAGLKNLSDDELKKLPAGFMDELGKFMTDKAEREYFKSCPDPHRIVGEGFQRLPNDAEKSEFARLIIYWCIKNCPNLINEIAREEKEKKQSMQQSS